MNIGEHIRDKRKTFGLTQVELAKRSGVGIRFVRELENGKNIGQSQSSAKTLWRRTSST